MRCLLILVTMAGMSTTLSRIACSRAMSIAISVPVLPTPALQVGILDLSIQSRPQTPLQHCQRKGRSGEYSTTSLQVHRISVGQSDWVMWQLSHLYWASLPQSTQLYSSHLYRPPSSPFNLLKPNKRLQRLGFQRNPQQQLHSPQCEDVLYSPEPPFLFVGGSGNETTVNFDDKVLPTTHKVSMHLL